MFFALSIYFWGDYMAQVFRYKVVGRDPNGDVIVFDGLFGDADAMGVPEQADTRIPLH